MQPSNDEFTSDGNPTLRNEQVFEATKQTDCPSRLMGG